MNTKRQFIEKIQFRERIDQVKAKTPREEVEQRDRNVEMYMKKAAKGLPLFD